LDPPKLSTLILEKEAGLGSKNVGEEKKNISEERALTKKTGSSKRIKESLPAPR